MKRLLQKFCKSSKGFSLVELLVTVAILSIVTLAVGAAMVSSARNYSKGNLEVDLQQESQVTANLISNLVLDATALQWKPGNELEIKQNVSGTNVVYTIKPNASNQLVYTVCYEDGSSLGLTDDDTEEVLADKVTYFDVDASKYGETKNIVVTLEFTEGEQNFKTTYNMTSRNGKGDESTALLAIRDVVLEPGETYTFRSVANRDITWGALSSAGTMWVSTNSREATVQVGLNEPNGIVTFSATTVPEGGEAAISETVNIYVRRVAKLNLIGSYDAGMYEAGTQYRIVPSFASIENKNLTYVANAVNGNYNFREFEDVIFDVTSPAGGGALCEVVENISEISDTVNTNKRNCSITIKLKKKLEIGDRIVITATAKRPSPSRIGTDPEVKGYGKLNANTEEVTAQYIIERKADICRGDFYDFDVPAMPNLGSGRWFTFFRQSTRDKRLVDKDSASTFIPNTTIGEPLTLCEWYEGGSNFGAGDLNYAPGATPRTSRAQRMNFEYLEPQHYYVYQMAIVWQWDGEQRQDLINKCNNYTGDWDELHVYSYEVSPVTFNFQYFTNTYGASRDESILGALGLGTTANPYLLKACTSNDFYMTGDAVRFDFAQAKFGVVVYELNAGTWQLSSLDNPQVSNISDKIGKISIFPQSNKVGKTFKLLMNWKSGTGIRNLFENTYFDEATGQGVMYVKVVN